MKDARKQNLGYGLLVIMTILATFATYHYKNQEWIAYREAEEKYRNKEYAKAIPLYKMSLEKGVTAADANLHLATSYVVMGNFADAIVLYQKYLSTHPKDKKAHLDLAKALEWSGNLKEAEIEYQNILENKYD